MSVLLRVTALAVRMGIVQILRDHTSVTANQNIQVLTAQRLSNSVTPNHVATTPYIAITRSAVTNARVRNSGVVEIANCHHIVTAHIAATTPYLAIIPSMVTNAYVNNFGMADTANCRHIVTAHPAAKQASVMRQMKGMFVCVKMDGKDATAQKRLRRVRVRLA